MKKKMNLKSLQVKSFVTSINSAGDLKGGTGTAIESDDTCPVSFFCTKDPDCDTITRKSVACHKTTEISKAEYTCDVINSAIDCYGGRI